MIQASRCSRWIHGESQIVVKSSHREERDDLSLSAVQDDVRTLVEAQLPLEERGAARNITGIQIDMM
jgi:hypothetical protein